MNAQQLEQEALKLEPEARAELVDRLLVSLDPINDEEWREAWAAEAERRDAEMTADPSIGTPAEEVFRRIRARLK